MVRSTVTNLVKNEGALNSKEYIICADCGRKVLKKDAIPHKFNSNTLYCQSCFNFWFKKG